MGPFLCHRLGRSERQTLRSSPEGRAWPMTPSAAPDLLIHTHPRTAWYVGVGGGRVGFLCSTGASNVLRNLISCHVETWEVGERQHHEGRMLIGLQDSTVTPYLGSRGWLDVLCAACSPCTHPHVPVPCHPHLQNGLICRLLLSGE